MIKEIEQIIRNFDYDDYGLNFEVDKTHEWPPVLATQIVKAIAAEIDRIVEDALR